MTIREMLAQPVLRCPTISVEICHLIGNSWQASVLGQAVVHSTPEQALTALLDITIPDKD